ncbi:hypothetical protein ACFL6G_01680 [candidate division KSB1 bacterium]
MFHVFGNDYTYAEYGEQVAGKFFVAFSDLKHHIVDAVSEEDKVVIRMTETDPH